MTAERPDIERAAGLTTAALDDDAPTIRGPEWSEVLPDDDSADAISSGWAIGVVFVGYLVLTLLVLFLAAKFVGVLW